MQNVDDLAKLCKVKLNVLTSFIKHPDAKAINLDPKDSTNPMHYIGRALSLYIYDDHDKLLCNDVCLGSINIYI